jgi:hypothetical protein
LKQGPFGLWRFETKSGVENNLDLGHRKFNWLSKRYPKLIDRAGNEAADENSIHWLRWPGERRGRWYDNVVRRWR